MVTLFPSRTRALLQDLPHPSFGNRGPDAAPVWAHRQPGEGVRVRARFRVRVRVRVRVRFRVRFRLAPDCGKEHSVVS